MRSIVVVLFMLLTGCVNLSTKTQPDNLAVQELRESSDCAYHLFGIMIGNATYDQAFANPSAPSGTHPGSKSPRLTKVRSVDVHDYFFLFAGARCVELVGE